MWLSLLSSFFNFRPGRPTPALYVLIGIGVLLIGLDTWQRYQERQTEKIRFNAQRAMILDSLQRAGELRTQRQFSRVDAALTDRYLNQAAAAVPQRTQDEALEKRFRAARVVLPAL